MYVFLTGVPRRLPPPRLVQVPPAQVRADGGRGGMERLPVHQDEIQVPLCRKVSGKGIVFNRLVSRGGGVHFLHTCFNSWSSGGGITFHTLSFSCYTVGDEVPCQLWHI